MVEQHRMALAGVVPKIASYDDPPLLGFRSMLEPPRRGASVGLRSGQAVLGRELIPYG